MVRRPLVWVAAIVLFVEAVGIALLNWFLGTVVDRQDMSMAGLDSDVMARSSKIGGLVFGLYFLACAVTALLVALRQRPPGVLGRVLLISAAVVHALLGAFTVGLVGWGAFTFMMVVLALIVFTLLAYDGREAGPVDAEPEAGGTGGGEGDTAEEGSTGPAGSADATSTGPGEGDGVTAGKVDLGKADLGKADLGKADLTKADLTKADLTKADLTKADLTKADLTKADLTKADLTKADLTKGDLAKADLAEGAEAAGAVEAEPVAAAAAPAP
ncbi:pentapeptide repeat-containing protein [Streptomyces sp. NPDC058751]|uniref:pentapeptide repeat-containing protein n=1 Tax=Streptomyces sp. NPDC058751 TaxID=3346623 RepID=UPI0036793DC2